MNTYDVTVLSQYLAIVEGIRRKDIILFRGQDCNAPLLPKIARHSCKTDTTGREQEMLEDLRRRGGLLIDHRLDAWEMLGYVQHFGMETRLLDWTSNPLVALWFACKSACNIKGPNDHTYVYILVGSKLDLLDRKVDLTPFEGSQIRILKPSLNTARIVAQAGWFTVHRYSSENRQFVPLEDDGDLQDGLTMIRIPKAMHDHVLVSLDRLGVNYQTLFPDAEGLCNYVNWLYEPQRIGI